MKIKLQIIVLFFICLASVGLKAQDGEFTDVEILQQRTDLLESAVQKLQKFKVSGYIQTQYQWAEYQADGNNFKLSNRANAYEAAEEESFGRFGVRRGRIKFTYEDGIFSGVFQPDFTDKNGSVGITLKDVYLNVRDPWFGTSALRAGIFDRPFGHEIAYSSSRRESPERSRIFQTLFPDERDLGAMLILQPAKTSPWNILKLEAGMFAGNGIRPQISSGMDFIGHLSVTKEIGDLSISGGVSAHLGGVLQTDSTTFVMEDKKFVGTKSGDNFGKYATRQYFGVDFQFSAATIAGFTNLRAEYLFGEHAQNKDGNWDYKFTGIPALNSTPVYMRKISGGYILLAQDLGQTPFTVVAKYDWYNPNTQVSGNEVGAIGSETVAKDLAMSNIGLGLIWRIDPSLKLTAYYDIVKNETSENINGWKEDRKDNVLTVRLQYKF